MDKASPSFQWDHDKGAAGTSSVSGGTATEGPFGIGTSSSNGGTTIVSGYDSETSSSTTRM
jgi:hypothetical protein